MKRVLLVIAALLSLTVLLAACKKSGDTISTPTAESTPATVEATPAPTELPPYEANVLTGEPKGADYPEGQRITAVMVNNIVAARPQRGLSKADILFEIKVEGGITRFMPVFTDYKTVGEVGPVRSGRDQFLQLLMPWNILYYHDGESIFCTQFVSVYGYSGLNIGGKNYFKTPIHPIVSHRNNRGRDVAYEHTEFTSGKEICKAASDAGISLYAPSEGTFFHFADYRTDEVNKLKGEPSAKKIAIVHSESYRTSFSYSALSHTYAMQMYNSSKKATENTVDELTGEQLTFENVVVCFADMDAYAGDSHDVQEVQYIKGGDAYLFTRGGVQVGRWEKTYPTNPLKLYTKSGEEMTLNRGKTYFALVDNDELSNFSYQ